MTLNKLITFVLTKMNNEKFSYEKKYQTSKDCANLINSFIEKRKDKIMIGSYFLKIKELYILLEQCENFDIMFDYIKKRLIAIKSIHEQSDKYAGLLDSLTKTIESTEQKYKELLNLYDETLKNLEEFETIMQEMNVLDNEMKELLA